MTACDPLVGGSAIRIAGSFDFKLRCDEKKDGVNSTAVYTCDRGRWRLGDQYVTPECKDIVTTTASPRPPQTDRPVTTVSPSTTTDGNFLLSFGVSIMYQGNTCNVLRPSIFQVCTVFLHSQPQRDDYFRKFDCIYLPQNFMAFFGNWWKSLQG